MSRSIFSGVCDSCFDLVVDKVWHKYEGKTTTRNGVRVNFLSREFLLNAAGMHRECLLAAVRDSCFIFEWGWAETAHVLETDLELVHAFCQGHSEPDNLIAWLVNSRHLSIDVYRYLEQNFNDWIVGDRPQILFINGVNEGNFDLAQYVAPKIKKFDGVVGQLCLKRNGAKGLEILSCYTDVKSELIEIINAMDLEEIENTPKVKLNIQELLAKNFICGSQICHKI